MKNRLLISMNIIALLLLITIVNAEPDCPGLSEVCVADCNDECELLKWEYCQEHDYSGCALDVFCYCNICGIYDTKWCPEYGDYLPCAEGAKGTYVSCINSCQSKREAGSDVSTCWKDCNDAMDREIIECKQVPCHDFCIEKGFETGEWARYTSEYGWDSCYCTGEKRNQIINEPIKPPKDYQELPEEIATADAEISDENTIIGKIKWWFTKQPVIKSTETGRIMNLLNKKGITVFRDKQKKWIQVGIGTPLYPGDMLKVTEKSKAKLEIWLPEGGRETIDLLPNTIYESHSKDPNLKYSGDYPISVITKGAMKVIYDRITGSKPKIYHKTPTVVLGIRGTEFYMAHDDSTETDTVMVYEGSVEVEDDEGTIIIIDAMEMAEFNDGIAQDIETLTESEWDMTIGDDDTWDETYEDSILTIPIVKVMISLVLILAGIMFYRMRKKKI